jgi:hypothetical protein
VGFVPLTEAPDLTAPAGRAMAGLLAVSAAFEREILGERTRAGLALTRLNGKVWVDQQPQPRTRPRLYRAGAHPDLSADNYFLMPLSFYHGFETIQRATPVTRTDQNFGIGAEQKAKHGFLLRRGTQPADEVLEGHVDKLRCVKVLLCKQDVE